MNIALIGCGYWGTNYIRIARDSIDSTLRWCSDIQKQFLDVIKKKDNNIKTTTDYRDILNDSKVDAVIISTPAKTHYKIAKECLTTGKHVLVEKPLTCNSGEAEHLIKLSEKANKILMVGHVFEFNEGVNKVKEFIDNKEIGNVFYLHSSRTGLGPIRRDVNVLWDLASHDISIILYFLKQKPLSAMARGECYLQKDIEDVVFVTLSFENKIFANIHVSWLDPFKTRKLTVVGDKKMVVFDDVSTEPVRLFDKGISYLKKGADFGEFKMLLRDGDIILPKIKATEPLKEEYNHFIECIKNNKKPLCDGVDGLKVVRVLEAAQQSLKNNSKIIKLN